MQQVLQRVAGGKTSVMDVPKPICGPHDLLVANHWSLISAGTERSVVELAQSSLIEKARRRPEQVRRVLEKISKEGFFRTVHQVQAKLAEAMPLGYSSAGIVLACGDAVQRFKPNDRVAVAAPHAQVVAIGQNLAARVPDDVNLQDACFAGVGAVAMQGIRLAKVELGARVAVVGLGLIGQIAAALLRAQGCQVVGVDPDPQARTMASTMGIEYLAERLSAFDSHTFTDGHGLDAALICASTKSNGPLVEAADACMRGGRVVLVGVAKIELPREIFFKKELIFQVSASLGAGRWDPHYEQHGNDYPIGFARWTVQRNMEAVLGAIKDNSLNPQPLVSRSFDVASAADAYDSLMQPSHSRIFAVCLNYPEIQADQVTAPPLPSGTIAVSQREQVHLGIIGAGNFARLTMLPALKKISNIALRGVASARGASAEILKRDQNFDYACADPNQLIADPDIDAVLILTRHSTHADLVCRALEAGKHVFVEKPLCVSFEELDAIGRTVARLGDRCPLLTLGYNRRFSPAVTAIRDHFAGFVPEAVQVRFLCGELPADSWVHRSEEGGRWVGEACHAIDLCVAVHQSPIVSARAFSATARGASDSSHDRTQAIFQHGNGAISQVSYIAGGDRVGPKERLEVHGQGRSAHMEDFDRVELWSRGTAARLKCGGDKGHAAGVESFIRSIRSGDGWPIPWAQLWSVSWASLAALRSIQIGADVSLESSPSKAVA